MHCIKKISEDLFWIGVNDRRLAMFEGVYSVPDGVSYNSYLLKDEKTVLMDTVDKAMQNRFFENLDEALGGRKLDFVVVQHMEPDHSGVLLSVLRRHPETVVVCNAKTLAVIRQFNEVADIDARVRIVDEGDSLCTGRHTLHFVMAPMVHWPEVMVTYDSTDKVLFSSDGFGCFGALNGALFADEVDFERDYMDEARRYYANIVGKYGMQVEALLGKAAGLDIAVICPLHGFVWRKKIQSILSKYLLWSAYTPEEQGVMIAYASIYGNTENAAEILSTRLREKGVRTVMFDVSVTPASDIVAAAFKWSHLVLASPTYNAGIFVTMDALLSDLAAHNIQRRTVAIIENGTWAPASGGLIRDKLAACRDITFVDDIFTVESSLKKAQMPRLEALADAIAATLPPPPRSLDKKSLDNLSHSATIDMQSMFKLSYGLFVLSARHDGKDNGCIINTVTQITEKPLRVSVAVNKANLTHDMIAASGAFNVSVLTESVPFKVFEQFGFHSGRDTDKFAGQGDDTRTTNGIRYVADYSNVVISAKVSKTFDYDTHTLFIAEITQAFALSSEPSATYQYYFDNIKPKPQLSKNAKRGFLCKICAHFQEGDTLPPDFTCPLCKHGPADFTPVNQ